jgi:hypothetical protein
MSLDSLLDEFVMNISAGVNIILDETEKRRAARPDDAGYKFTAPPGIRLDESHVQKVRSSLEPQARRIEVVRNIEVEIDFDMTLDQGTRVRTEVIWLLRARVFFVG